MPCLYMHFEVMLSLIYFSPEQSLVLLPLQFRMEIKRKVKMEMETMALNFFNSISDCGDIMTIQRLRIVRNVHWDFLLRGTNNVERNIIMYCRYTDQLGIISIQFSILTNKLKCTNSYI